MQVTTKFIVFISAVMLLTAPSLLAKPPSHSNAKSHNSTRYIDAKVLDVEPIVRYVTVSRPERVCEEVEYQPRRNRRHDSSGGTIAGGLLGGVIGRQIGGGSGRDAATIAGVLIGSAIGHDKEVNKERSRRNDRYETRTRQECSTRYQRSQEERIDGYYVTYRYKGETYTTRTRHQPGKKIRLAVDVRPVDEEYQSPNDDYSDNDTSYDRYADDRYGSDRDD